MVADRRNAVIVLAQAEITIHAAWEALEICTVRIEGLVAGSTEWLAEPKFCGERRLDQLIMGVRVKVG
jgi:hypothetical protein